MGTGQSRKFAVLSLMVLCALCLFGAGCKILPVADVPTEVTKVAHPEYTIAPPDILLIDAVNLVPRPPYKIAPLDGLLIRVTIAGIDPEKERPDEIRKGQPINGLYRVEVDGKVDLGFSYGKVDLAGLTIPEAEKVLHKYLKELGGGFKKEFTVDVALAESRALQQIRGEHLVRQDGKVVLGTYGSVFVAGMTLPEAKQAIEEHLSQFLFQPEVALDVTGYNSKVYYVILDLYAAGETVIRLPVTGNETVLDAIGEIKGLPGGTSRHRIKLARRAPPGEHCGQVLDVDWNAITRGGATDTNYQLLPGDRVYVGVDPFIATDQWLAKLISPVERILGVNLLGSAVVHDIATPLGVVGGVGGVGGVGAGR
jgi:polysaccharide export outer membrane protein